MENRWPQVGDAPFTSEGIWTEQASTDSFGAGFWPRVIGFKRAADILVEHTLERRHDRDFVVYPIVFSYRHFLELTVKELAYMVRIARCDPNAKRPFGHTLGRPWDELRSFASEYPDVTDPDALSVVDSVISEFERVDPGSFAFRYGVSGTGEQLIPDDLKTIDLRNLMGVMNRTESYFDGYEGWLSALLDSGP